MVIGADRRTVKASLTGDLNISQSGCQLIMHAPSQANAKSTYRVHGTEYWYVLVKPVEVSTERRGEA
jgi:hypothetical protein